MCEKFLSALSVILIFTFCSVYPGAGIPEKWKRQVEGARIKLGINEKRQADKNVAEFESAKQKKQDKKAAEIKDAAEGKKQLEAIDASKKAIPTPPPTPGQGSKKDIIPLDQIKDGYYKTPSGKLVEVKSGQKFVEVDGKYLRIGEPTQKQPQTVIDKMKQAVDDLTKKKQKTLSEGIQEALNKRDKNRQVAATKREIDSLMAKQMGQGIEESAQNKSPLEKVFIDLGKNVALRFPDSSMAIMRASIKANDTAIHRKAKDVNNWARGVSSGLKSKLGLEGKAFSKSFKSEFEKQKKEALKKFNEDLKKEIRDLLIEGKSPLTAKDIADREKVFKKHLESKDFKKEVQSSFDTKIEEQKQVELADFGEKIKKENAKLEMQGKPKLSDEEIKKRTDNFKASLEGDDFKYKILALNDMQRFQKDNPKEYQKKLLAIAKTTGLVPSKIESLLKPKDAANKNKALNSILTNPKNEYERMQKKAIEAAYLESIKDEMKKTTFEKITDISTKAREKAQSGWAMVVTVGGSTILGLIIAAIQNRITSDAALASLTTLLESNSQADNSDSAVSKMKNENLRLALTAERKAAESAKSAIDAQKAEEEAAIKAQMDMLDAAAKVSNFYLTFDDFFKNSLSKFGYNDRTLNATSKLKYSGGTVDSGIVLLFEYAGAGNIANSFTPVCTKILPSAIAGKTIPFDSILESVNDTLSYELMATFLGGYPEPIFLIKAISLFNTATKQFSDPEKRDEFLQDELFKLFFKLTWTVDESATARANALEPNQDLWEPVYIKDVASCLFNGPDVLRDMLKELVLTEVEGAGGAVSDVSFEQFIIDRFDDFKILKNVPFEGDVDFEPDTENFNPKEIEVGLLIILMRALNDVLKLEKSLVTQTEHVTMKHLDGKEESVSGKALFQQITSLAWNNLMKSQQTFVDAVVELGFDLENSGNKQAYDQAEKKYFNTGYAYDIALLNFRKKVSTYVFDRTQGLEPETVLDFIVREMKRLYILAEDKNAFEVALNKVFKDFAPNFPFTAQDILKYAKDSSPIKHPTPKIIN